MRQEHRLFAPAMVLASSQTHGRGRGSNRWWSGDGSITMTLALAVSDRLPPNQLPLIAGVALRNALAGFVPESRLSLKWPNDIVVGGRKLAGLLCERQQRLDLIGIGVNVNVAPGDPPPSLRERITSLSQLAKQPLDKTEVLITIVKQLHLLLTRRDEYPFASILREYERHHYLRGRRISVAVSWDPQLIKGTCQGLDSMGRLLLRRRARQHRIVSGHVQLV